jgi:hypothetical protein
VTTPNTTIADQILTNGTDDWVSAAEIYGLVVEYSTLTTPCDRRDLALGAVARLILTGYVEPGETPKGGHGFVPWLCSAEEAVARIVREWSARTDDDLMPGETVWLRNTPAGHAIGEAVLAREAAE